MSFRYVWHLVGKLVLPLLLAVLASNSAMASYFIGSPYYLDVTQFNNSSATLTWPPFSSYYLGGLLEFNSFWVCVDSKTSPGGSCQGGFAVAPGTNQNVYSVTISGLSAGVHTFQVWGLVSAGGTVSDGYLQNPIDVFSPPSSAPNLQLDPTTFTLTWSGGSNTGNVYFYVGNGLPDSESTIVQATPDQVAAHAVTLGAAAEHIQVAFTSDAKFSQRSAEAAYQPGSAIATVPTLPEWAIITLGLIMLTLALRMRSREVSAQLPA